MIRIAKNTRILHDILNKGHTNLRLACFSFLLISVSFPVLALDAEHTKAWEADLDFLAAEFPKREGGFTDDERIAFDAKIASVRARLATLDDEHVIVGVMQSVALARNAHTGVLPALTDSRFGRVPIRLWYFADGLYVVKARPAFAHLLGARLTSIGGHDIEAAVDRVATLMYANRTWKKFASAIRATTPALLYGLDLAQAPDRADYGFTMADGSSAHETLTAELPSKAEGNPLAIWDLVPASRSGDVNWRYALGADSASAPLYLSNPNDVLWHTYLKKSKTLYVRYSSSFFLPGDDRYSLRKGLVETFKKKKPKKLVIDLRLNSGGDLTQMRRIFDRMLQEDSFPAPDQVYAITGQGTFSAGLFHAANLKQQGAIIVGELAGDDLDFWAEIPGALELPNSKVRIYASTGFHSYSKIAYPQYADMVFLNLDIDTLEPDIIIRMTYAEFVAGRDPIMESILAR